MAAGMAALQGVGSAGIGLAQGIGSAGMGLARGIGSAGMGLAQGNLATTGTGLAQGLTSAGKGLASGLTTAGTSLAKGFAPSILPLVGAQTFAQMFNPAKPDIVTPQTPSETMQTPVSIPGQGGANITQLPQQSQSYFTPASEKFSLSEPTVYPTLAKDTAPLPMTSALMQSQYTPQEIADAMKPSKFGIAYDFIKLPLLINPETRALVGGIENIASKIQDANALPKVIDAVIGVKDGKYTPDQGFMKIIQSKASFKTVGEAIDTAKNFYDLPALQIKSSKELLGYAKEYTEFINKGGDPNTIPAAKKLISKVSGIPASELKREAPFILGAFATEAFGPDAISRFTAQDWKLLAEKFDESAQEARVAKGLSEGLSKMTGKDVKIGSSALEIFSKKLKDLQEVMSSSGAKKAGEVTSALAGISDATRPGGDAIEQAARRAQEAQMQQLMQPPQPLPQAQPAPSRPVPIEPSTSQRIDPTLKRILIEAAKKGDKEAYLKLKEMGVIQ